jgi:CRAL/TRIO domain
MSELNLNLPRAQRNLSPAVRAAAADTLINEEPVAKRAKVKLDPTLTLTTPELERSQNVQQAAESHKRLLNLQQRQRLKGHKVAKLTAYDFAQQAIVASAEETEDDIADRLYKLQCFRDEYRIQDTVEEGVTLIHQLMEMMPGYLLSVDFAPRYGSYIFVWDFAAFYPAKLKEQKDLRIFLGALYYICQCLSTNLKAVRSGVVFITECQGMSAANWDMQLEEKMLAELFCHYPFKYKECLWLNTPTIANIAYALMKPLVRRDFLASWRMGCKLDGYEGRIDSLFKMPTPAIAQEQLLKRVEGFLTERARNVRNFELSECMVTNPPPEDAAPADRSAAGTNRPGRAAPGLLDAQRQGVRRVAPRS